MNLKQKVMSGLAWSAAGRLLAQLVTWCITLVIIRLLSPEDYGLMALAGVFVAFLALLNEMGLGAAIVQRKDIDIQMLRPLFGLVLLVSALFYFILFFSATLIADFYNDPRLVLLVKVLSLEFIINAFAVIPKSQLLRDMKFRQIAIVDFTSAISGSVITLVLALMGYGIWALVFGTLIIRTVATLGYNITNPLMHLPKISMKGMKYFVVFGGYVTFGRIFWFFYSNSDALIIGKILGKELLGYYSIGLMLATLPMEKVSGIINQVAFPAFTSIQSDIDMVGRHFLKAIRIMSFIAFPVLWGISSISTEIILVFLGEKWLQAVVPMQIIAIIIPLRMISNLMSSAVFGVGRADVAFYLVVIPFALFPIAFFFGAHYGLLGVSMAWLIVFPLVFLSQIMFTIRVLKISFLSIIEVISKPIVAVIAMYVSIIFTKNLNLFENQNLAQMFLLIFTGALVYFIATFIINRSGYQEILSLFKK